MIFEDGKQRRDFVHVEDIARAFLLALDHPRAAGEVYNIASGEDRSVEEVAALLAGAMGRPGLLPEITGKARTGAIRHCIPDLAKAREELGLGAPRDFAQGLAELAEWVARQQAEDRVAQARRELEARGLLASRRPPHPAAALSWLRAAPASSAPISPPASPPAALSGPSSPPL